VRWVRLASLLLAIPAAGDGEQLDPKTALSIMLRVITYDRSFKAPESGFMVVIPTEPGLASARDQVLAASRELNLTSIQGHELRFAGVDLRDPSGLAAAVAQRKASAIVVIPGTSAPMLAEINRVSQASHLYTLALDPAAVEQKQALLSVAPHEGRPQIVLNVDAARALGATFDNSVLKVARLVQ
jgi:hypothetical protein